MSIKGRYHCGKTSFEIAGKIPEQLTRCTCFFCSKRGAQYAYYRPDQFQVNALPPDDGVYRWNTQRVDHHFCNSCGRPTFSDSLVFERDGTWEQKTRRIGVNARLFDDFDAASAAIVVIDSKHLW
ncbi:MAG: hypothetical protein ABI114_00215 [Rhodanobacter sp.]